MIPDRILDLRSALTTAPNGMRFGVFPLAADPLTFVRAGSQSFEGVFYFASPDGTATGGLGMAAKSTASGQERFSAVRAAVEAWQLPDPFRAFAGFAFSQDGPRSEPWASFGGADAVLPLATALRRGDERILLVALPPGVDADLIGKRLAALETPSQPMYPNLGDHSLESCPPVSEWTAAVGEAVDAIHRGDLRKVVLTRSVVVRSDAASASDGASTGPPSSERVQNSSCDSTGEW
jgi:salicylate biosynthesis isochorismate synthase